MATFSKRNLTINNFQDPISYTSGKGTQTKTLQMYNFMDNKLRFLMDEYDCVIYDKLVNNGWNKIQFEVNTTGGDKKPKKKIETLWKNYR